MRFISIDNPGGGDCGFYSIANGLLPILQSEIAQGSAGILSTDSTLSYI